MAEHKFKVGQMVELVPAHFGLIPSGRAYKVLRLLPRDAGQHQYRIKTITEEFERVAKESDLVRSASAK